jgi:glucuronate isomerase
LPPRLCPRALFDRYNIEVIATTESPLDTLEHHAAIMADNASGAWGGRVVTAYRPDPVVDPEFEGFRESETLSEITGEDCLSWQGYLAAHRQRRAFLRSMAPPAPTTATPPRRPPTSRAEAEALFDKVAKGSFTAQEAELFRAQMLTEMAAMSLEDGLVMQIHPGSFRNHNQALFEISAATRAPTSHPHRLCPRAQAPARCFRQ